MKLRLLSPNEITPAVKGILSVLKLNERDVIFLDYKEPFGFVPSHNDCHLNVWVQCNHEGGNPVSGWMIAEDPAIGFIEAQFHTVWKSSDGKLQDITPRMDEEKTIMFFPDPLREITFFEYKGSVAINTYDNVKMQNERLIDEIKEITIVSNSDFAVRHGFYTQE